MTTTRSLALLWLAAFLALVACAVRVWQAHIDTRQLEHQLGTAQTRLARSNAQLVTGTQAFHASLLGLVPLG